jgi:glutamine synthetase
MGPGQHEVDFRYSDPLSAADNATTFKSAVKTIAGANGLHACFQPKPLENEAGSGMHINISAVSTSGADVRSMFMAGILARIKEMTLFLNPTEESYRRLGSMKAPKYITWSHENRSQLIRIPASDENDRKRIELRSPDAGANPYIAYALLISAGLEGVEKKLKPSDAVNLDLFKATSEVTDRLDRIPDSIEKARAAASASEFIRSVLPAGILDSYGVTAEVR